VGFEVPYVLWEFRAGNNFPRSDSGSSTLQAPLQTKPKRQLSLTIGEVPSSSSNDVGFRIEEPEGATSTFALREPPLMKRKIPFNNFIDSLNIVDVPEEWLYDYPGFVDFEPHESHFTRQSLRNFKFEAGEVVWNAVTAFEERGDKTETQEEYTPAAALPDNSGNKWGPPWLRRSGNLVRDVAKKKIHGKASAGADSWSNYQLIEDQELWDKLRALRKADRAKKRFIWLPHASLDSALICFLSSHEIERESISLFFDNHAHYSTLFSDEAARVQNVWRTEFHTRFLQLLVDEQYP
jgi:hypothetical protein